MGKKEDLQRLKDLDRLAELESMAEQEAVAERDQPPSEVETGVLEATARSAAQTVLFDFADEAEAGMTTLYNAATGDDIQSFADASADYDKNLQTSREEFAKNKEEYPVADTVGMGIGIIGSLFTGGAAAKATAKGLGFVAPKAAQAFQGMGKVKQAATLGAGMSGLSTLGRSDDKLSLQAALETAGSMVVGGALGGGISALGGKISSIRASRHVGAPIEEAGLLVKRALRGIGISNNSEHKALEEALNSKGISMEDYLKFLGAEKGIKVSSKTGVLSETKGKLINSITESMPKLHKNTKDKVSFYAQQRDALLATSSAKMGRTEYANRIKASLSGKVKTGDMQAVNQILKSSVTHKSVWNNKDFPDGIVEEIGGSITLPQMLSFRQEIGGLVNFESTSSTAAVKRLVYKAMNDLEDETVKSTISEAAKITNKKLRHKMSMLLTARDAMKHNMENNRFGATTYIRNAIRDNFAAGLVGGSVAMSNPIAGAALLLTAVAARKANSSARLNRSIAFNALQLKNALPKVGERAVRKLWATLDARGIMPFQHAAASIIGQAELKEMPLGRTYEDVIERQASLISIVEDFEPDLASQLRKAIELDDRDGLGAIMAEISKLPEASSFTEPGIGWNGKVYSEEDKATVLKDYMSKAREMGIPYVETLRVKKAVLKPGPVDIPQAEPQGRPPALMSPRNKNRHTY